ncbi:hypothetical protein K8R14_00570 [bacterium]|nr:hypothetical protein [bacterium]
MRKFLKFVGIVILCLLLLFLSLLLFVILKSRSWEKGFVDDLNSQYLVSEGLVFEDAMDEKIEGYVLSGSDTEFVTFTPTEVSQLLFSSVSDMVGESGLSITNVYVEPAVGNWSVCGRFELVEVKGIHTWVCVDVSKDSMQTAQLFLEDIQFQGFSVSKIYPKLLILANQGIAEALVTTNENGFVGRIFENIELLEEGLVVKGSLY